MFLALFCLVGALFSACSSTPSMKEKSKLTFANVKKNIVKGQSTQDEIIKALGSPNIITRNKKDEEVWTYSRQSYDAESGSFGFGLIFLGKNKAFSSASSSSFDLIITFDKNDVVKDYSVVASQF